jgi:Zn-finger nucleic acid-binding protein
MKCPRCQTPDLQPTMIEQYLPAMGCGTCRGSLVSLLYYRHWAETQKAPAAAAVDPNAGAKFEATDTAAALRCPKCGRIMMKYKVSGAVSNRLDVCSLCDEAWLDGGEWELLEALQLNHRLPAIFTDEWQRRIRHQLSEETRRSTLARVIGEKALARVEEFRAWLADNEHKSQIMTYLFRS